MSTKWIWMVLVLACPMIWAQQGAAILHSGRPVPTNYSGDRASVAALLGHQAQPLTLASADFDEDGTPDLASGYGAFGGRGIVTIHRGNVAALWPYGAALRNGEPPAFLPDARAIAVPEAPDFLGAGDFDADGHWDLVVAHKGSKALYFLPGDGHGNFGEPRRIDLPGAITALITGETNRADGLTDVVVAVASDGGAQALVFESPNGALRGDPEVFSLPAAASALALTPLSGNPMNDLAIAAGHELLTVHARDRRLSMEKSDRAKVPTAEVTRQSFPFSINELAAGNFSGTASGLAALGDDGKVHYLGTQGETALPSGGSVSHMIAGRVSASRTTDLILVDRGLGKVHVVSGMHATSLDVEGGSPAAILPMHLNPLPVSSLVTLNS